MTKSKTFLITGATGGIGNAVCHRLAAAGHRLILAARTSSKLQALQDSLSTPTNKDHLAIPLDMTDDQSIAQFKATLGAESLDIDGVVLMPPQIPPTNDCLPGADSWRTMFQNSFIGPLEVLKAAIERMRPDPANGKRAKVVIISGISSAQVLGHYATSNVLRCAWLAEAKTLAFALGERGIHVNTLSLGGTLTPGYKSSLEKRASTAGVSFDERLAEETANVPLKKYGAPEEVAGAVEGLLSSFSDHLTGLNILHDGGFTRAY